jgi:hypothetical protein
LNDKNDFTEDLTEVQSFSTFVFYNALHRATGISANLGLNRIQSTIPTGETVTTGFSVGVSKAFFENKFRASANYLRNSNKFEEADNGYTSRVRASVSYAPTRAHKFLLTFSHLKNKSNNTLVSRSFNETCTRLTYNYRFDTRQKQKRKQ